jgi:hypothetical protein
MPNCFSLTRRNNLDAGPVSLWDVDEEICKHLNVEPWPDEYYHQWYGTIGLALACGYSFESIIEGIKGDIQQYPESIQYYKTKLRIAEFLRDNFASECWAEIGRR